MNARRIFRVLAVSALILLSVQTFADDPEAGNGIEIAESRRLTGSWVVEVESTATPEFYALQTFHAGGTVTETSDLLAKGGEGPGHGVWYRTEEGFAATFELFIFEPDGAPAGRIRVRETISVINENRFEGFSVADLILPDGTLIENIDNGPIHGRRIVVVPILPDEKLRTATPHMRRSWGSR
jgi:hypothetical protein